MPRIRVIKNCKLNENMEKVRELELPKRTWDIEGGEEWFRSTSNEGRDEGEELIDRETDLQLKRAERWSS